MFIVYITVFCKKSTKIIYFLINLVFINNLFAQVNRSIMEKLIELEEPQQVIKTLNSPTYTSKYTIKYKFKEITIEPEKIIFVAIPDKYTTLELTWLGFSHRQKGTNNNTWDNRPGLTTALVYSQAYPGDEFRYWAGPSSGQMGAKFGENSKWPEYDALYEWQRKGHKGLYSNQKSFNPVYANVIKIQNIGTDNVYLSSIDLKFIPPIPYLDKKWIFTKGSKFGNHRTLKGRKYGGGQNLRGIFPDSVVLSSKKKNQILKLPTSFSVEKNKLSINLKNQLKFSFMEIMCGDNHPDQTLNPSGTYGKPGNARINVFIVNSNNQKKRTLAKNINIPLEGVIFISEISEKVEIKKGDKIIIENQKNKSPL